MTRAERHIAVLSRLLENMDVYNSIQPTTERKKAIKAAIQALSQEPSREFEDYENEIEDLHNRLDIAEYDKERLREEVTNLEAKIQALEQEPCDDAISRDAAIEAVKQAIYNHDSAIMRLTELPSVTQKSGKCKNCKYFEYDSVAKVDGIPIIVAHEICNKWGDGCKTSEDGYCYLFEPQESEE